MASLPWLNYIERMVGKGHPTLADTVNRPLRQLLTESGYDPDANPFPGLMGPIANVKAFGAAVGTGGDDSTAIQAAINTELSVFFPDGEYKANNLTQSIDGQRLFATGRAKIIKNANGDLFTSSGNSVTLRNLEFRGESATPVFTGHNVVSSGGQFTMVDCGSRYAFARAVKCTGDGVTIRGTDEIFHTADATASGYDIEIGVSGTATLYHRIEGIRTNQATGGLLFTDCGSQAVIGCTFGKLTIAAGTGPVGVNGGIQVGNRILGNVVVGVSNAQFSANQFGAITFTISASVSGVDVDSSNRFQSGATVTNNGAGNNCVIRSVGVSGDIELKFGGDASEALLKIAPTTGRFVFPDAVVLENAMALICQTLAGGDGFTLQMNSSNDTFLSNTVTDRTQSYQVTGTNSGARHQFNVNGVPKACINNNGIIIGASGSPQLRSGSGSPEGAVTAPVGSLYTRTDGGALTSLYVKESGAGNTGWVAK